MRVQRNPRRSTNSNQSKMQLSLVSNVIDKTEIVEQEQILEFGSQTSKPVTE